MKKKKSRPKDVSGIKYELEEDSADIFLRYVEQNDIFDKDSNFVDDKSRKRKRRKNDRKERSLTIDLHGMTLDEARRWIDVKILPLLKEKGVCNRITIITGKGLHSGLGGGVLSKEIHSYVRDRFGNYIVDLEESPSNLCIDGLPIRGHFTVVIKP